MRRMIVLTLMLSLMMLQSTDASSQSSFKPGLKFGLTMGKQKVINSAPGLLGGGHDLTPGYVVGLYLDRRLFGNWRGAPEILYAVTGDKYEHENSLETGRTRKSKFRSNYVEFPILLRYYFKRGKIKPFMSFGPKFSYLFAVTMDPKPLPSSEDNNVLEYFDQANTSFVFGLGVEYGISYSPLTWIGEIRYSHGIQNITGSAVNLGFIGTPKMYTRVIMFTFGLKYK